MLVQAFRGTWFNEPLGYSQRAQKQNTYRLTWDMTTIESTKAVLSFSGLLMIVKRPVLV